MALNFIPETLCVNPKPLNPETPKTQTLNPKPLICRIDTRVDLSVQPGDQAPNTPKSPWPYGTPTEPLWLPLQDQRSAIKEETELITSAHVRIAESHRCREIRKGFEL